MAYQEKLGFTIVVILLFVAASEFSKYDIIAKCPETDSKCITLQKILSNSSFRLKNNTVWILKNRTYTIEGGSYDFNNVHNITLRGQDKKTTIKCISLKEHCSMRFYNSTRITIQNIAFKYPHNVTLNLCSSCANTSIADYGTCLTRPSGRLQESAMLNFSDHGKAWVFIKTHNVTFQNVYFSGVSGHWLICNPSGNYSFLSVGFYNFLSTLTDSMKERSLMLVNINPQEQFYMSMLNCSFKIWTRSKNSLNSTVLNILYQGNPKNGKSTIIIEKTKFTNIQILNLTTLEPKAFTLELTDVTAVGMVWNKTVPDMMTKEQITGSAISIYVEQFDCKGKTAGDKNNIRISHSNFSSYVSSIGSAVYYRSHVSSTCNQTMILNISDSRFLNNFGTTYANVLYAKQVEIRPQNSPSQKVKFSTRQLVLQNNMFQKNDVIKYRDRSTNICVRSRYIKNFFLQSDYLNYKINCPTEYPWRGIVYLIGFQGRNRVLFQNSTIEKNWGKGLLLQDTNMELHGLRNLISDNRSPYGAGIHFLGNSMLLLRNNSLLTITKNRAFLVGGGIYIHDNCSFQLRNDCSCFFQFIHDNGSYVTQAEKRDITKYRNIILLNNTASKSGNEIFNSNVNSCKLYTKVSSKRRKVGSTEIFKEAIFNKTNFRSRNKYVSVYYFEKTQSSLPRRICNCTNFSRQQDFINGRYSNLRECTFETVKIYPGQQVTLHLLVLADMNVMLQTPLHVNIMKSKTAEIIKMYKNTTVTSNMKNLWNQELFRQCNIITFPRVAPENNTNFTFLHLQVPLFSNTPLYYSSEKVYLYNTVKVEIYSTCPPGYFLLKGRFFKECICFVFLKKNGIKCHLQDLSFSLPQHFWGGIQNNSSNHILFSKICPRGYCKESHGNIRFSLIRGNDICDNGRVGVLCSQCPEGKSDVLGSFKCHVCSNSGLWFIVAFLLFGPILVFITCFFNLSITTRSIGGFLLYLHIVSINSENLQNSSSNPTQIIFSIFTLNINYGTCLYDGLDPFVRTFLSFAFPTYLLIIVGSAFLLPKLKCINIDKVHRKVGPRITPVLATIIWYSFALTTDAVVKCLLYTELCSTETRSCKRVWLYDGTLGYFSSPKHVVLGLTALFALTGFLIPITIMSIFGDLFRRCIRKQWYWNFLDTFQASFRLKFGFWVGVRLLVRIIVILLKFFLESKQVYLVIIYLILAVIAFQIIARPFRELPFERCLPESWKSKMTVDLRMNLAHWLDISFLLNLIALFSYLLYTNSESFDIVLNISRSVVTCEFFLILTYHYFEYSPLGPITKRKLQKIKKYLAIKIKQLKKKQSKPSTTSKDDNSDFNIQRISLILKPNSAKAAADSSDTENEEEAIPSSTDVDTSEAGQRDLTEPLLTCTYSIN